MRFAVEPWIGRVRVIRRLGGFCPLWTLRRRCLAGRVIEEVKRRVATAVSGSALAAVILFGAAAPAAADHHFMFISEVFPGVTADPTADFVELQMYAGGQTALTGQNQRLTFYGANGSVLHVQGFGANLSNAQSQRTALIGEDTTDVLFGVTSDYPMTGTNQIGPLGGAVCFSSDTYGDIDCVSWGTFNNTPALPVGNPETGPIPSGSSIVRSIAPGNASLLDAPDDTNDSQTDFSATATPTPCPNSAVQTPTVCDFSAPPATTPPAATTPAQKRGKCKKKQGKRSAQAAKKKCKKKRR